MEHSLKLGTLGYGNTFAITDYILVEAQACAMSSYKAHGTVL